MRAARKRRKGKAPLEVYIALEAGNERSCVSQSLECFIRNLRALGNVPERAEVNFDVNIRPARAARIDLGLAGVFDFMENFNNVSKLATDPVIGVRHLTLKFPNTAGEVSRAHAKDAVGLACAIAHGNVLFSLWDVNQNELAADSSTSSPNRPPRMKDNHLAHCKGIIFDKCHLPRGFLSSDVALGVLTIAERGVLPLRVRVLACEVESVEVKAFFDAISVPSESRPGSSVGINIQTQPIAAAVTSVAVRDCSLRDVVLRGAVAALKRATLRDIDLGGTNHIGSAAWRRFEEESMASGNSHAHAGLSAAQQCALVFAWSQRHAESHPTGIGRVPAELIRKIATEYRPRSSPRIFQYGSTHQRDGVRATVRSLFPNYEFKIE